jgi:hypothetical protein
MRGVSLSHATSPSETRSQCQWAVPRPPKGQPETGAVSDLRVAALSGLLRRRILLLGGQCCTVSARCLGAIVGCRSGRPGFSRYRVHHRAGVISKYDIVTRFMEYHLQKTSHRG